MPKIWIRFHVTTITFKIQGLPLSGISSVTKRTIKKMATNQKENKYKSEALLTDGGIGEINGCKASEEWAVEEALRRGLQLHLPLDTKWRGWWSCGKV
jgi:exopolysaccharide biosynthesis protein